MAFIVFEGLDGAGKTSLISGIKARMEKLKMSVFTAYEPGGSVSAQAIRELVKSQKFEPTTQMLLMSAARNESCVDGQIGDWMQARKETDVATHLLCDRYDASTEIYQKFDEDAVRAQTYATIAHRLDFPRPDLYVFVDVSFEESKRRRSQPCTYMGREYSLDNDVLEQLIGTEEDFNAMREKYLAFMRRRASFGLVPYVYIDTTSLTEEQKVNLVWEKLQQFL